MNKLQQLTETEGTVILDGGMGTMLFAAGLDSGNPPEEWNVLHPERIRAIHQGYIEAGARVILTNSFGGTRFRLKLHKLQDRVVELNRAAARIARAAADRADHLVVVAGSMGPTGEMLQPLGAMTFKEAQAAFAEQAAALAEGGVDVLWIETMSDLNEIRAAVAGAKSAGNLPVVATMTFDTHGRTMMGVTPVQALETLGGLELAAFGGNCGNGPGEIEGVIHAMHQAEPGAMLVAKANAGLPKWVNNVLAYDGTPEVMADYAVKARHLGAKLIGACCGSTPTHIKAMAQALADPNRKVLVNLPAPDSASEEKLSRRRSRRRRA